MSSNRFPGKVLAPFRGTPIIDHVVASVRTALPDAPMFVLTSDQTSDDPLAAHLASRNVAVYRGPLDDVLSRFQRCLAANPCRWVMRICADSPLLNEPLVRTVGESAVNRDQHIDLVTTLAEPRTFPRGQNVEVVRASALQGVSAVDVAPDEREHMTLHFHRNPERYRIVRIAARAPLAAGPHLAVDSIEDLRTLEALDEDGIQYWRSSRYWDGPA